jgi:GDP-L-fucose synthase
MKLIVTGSSGFLGTALCTYLEQQGHSLSRLTSAKCDLRQADSLLACLCEEVLE